MASSVITIPLGQPFLPTLAAHLYMSAGAGEDPTALKEYTLLVPTKGVCPPLTSLFHQLARQSGTEEDFLLPRLEVVGDQDPLSPQTFSTLLALGSPDPQVPLRPKVLSPLHRQSLLIHLLQKIAKEGRTSSDSGNFFPSDPPLAFWMDLAASLLPLLDQLTTEGKDLSLLSPPSTGERAAHWNFIHHILSRVAHHWPSLLAQKGVCEPAWEQRCLLTSLATQWETHPPTTPVVMAGCRGGTPACSHLLQVVSSLPQGMVVLPGYPSHRRGSFADPAHPFYRMNGFLTGREETSGALPLLKEWRLSPSSSPAENRTLLALEALTPSAPPSYLSFSQLKESWQKVALVETPHLHQEALAIALALRQVEETPGKTGALITPDPVLKKRVALALASWGIEVCPLRGTPLTHHPLGNLTLLSLRLALTSSSPVDWMGVLRHPSFQGPGFPSCESDLGSSPWHTWLAHFEIQILRALQPRLPFWTLPTWGPVQREEGLLSVLSPLAQWIEPLAQALRGGDLGSILKAHQEFLQRVTLPREWEGKGGRLMGQVFQELSLLKFNLKTPADYSALLSRTLESVSVPPSPQTRRIFLLTPAEARLHSFDMVILGALNEGVWPTDLPPDPWSNQRLRTHLNLPPLQEGWGLQALDFLQALGAPQVILSRSHHMKGSPTLPSRWLTQLRASLLGKLESHPTSAASPTQQFYELFDGTPWAQQAWELEQVSQFCPLSPPAPRPPLAARPRHMSVTKIETWMRHPYGIYSEMILRLKPLDPLERGLQPSDRGIFIHRALETFLTTPQIESLLPLDPEASLSTLLKIGEALASRLSDQILVKTVWWPRFQQMAHWFIKTQGPLCAQLQKVFCEISGSLTWEAPAGPFTLTAKADRIDALKTGKLRFIDYKTNTAPSQKDVALGYSPQLTVAAWMAQAGGFEGMAAGSPQELSYWILKGGHKGGHVVSITPPKEKTLDCLVKEAQEGVHQLVALFDDPTTPYLYCPRPEKGPLFDPYDHLARVGEWRTSL